MDPEPEDLTSSPCFAISYLCWISGLSLDSTTSVSSSMTRGYVHFYPIKRGWGEGIKGHDAHKMHVADHLQEASSIPSLPVHTGCSSRERQAPSSPALESRLASGPGLPRRTGHKGGSGTWETTVRRSPAASAWASCNAGFQEASPRSPAALLHCGERPCVHTLVSSPPEPAANCQPHMPVLSLHHRRPSLQNIQMITAPTDTHHLYAGYHAGTAWQSPACPQRSRSGDNERQA